jgi:hypothetical protein
MSNEMKHHQEDGSDDLRLPDDLAACEAQLASEPLAAPRLSRDELLYRAGWAAAEAKHALHNPPPSKGGARGGIPNLHTGTSPHAESKVAIANPSPDPTLRGRGAIVAWSTASAALAAALAVAITLRLVQPTRAPERNDALPLMPPLVVTSPRAGEAPPAATAGDAWLAALQSWATARRLATGEPLAVIGDLHTARWEHADASQEGAAAPDVIPAMTTRALLEEMLPRPRSAHVEGVGTHGVFDLLRPLTWGGETI